MSPEAGEPSPEPEQRKGKFNSQRDELLYIMSLEQWANASSGSSQSPQGWFARMSNAEVEIPDLLDAFREVIERVTLGDLAPLVGHFLIIEDDRGFVYVDSYPDEDQLIQVYEAREAEFLAWEGGTNG